MATVTTTFRLPATEFYALLDDLFAALRATVDDDYYWRAEAFRTLAAKALRKHGIRPGAEATEAAAEAEATENLRRRQTMPSLDRLGEPQ